MSYCQSIRIHHWVVFTLVATLCPGCKLIFEPPEDAAERFVEGVALRKDVVIKEFISDSDLYHDVMELSNEFRMPPYKSQSDFWRIDGVEEDESNGYTYVYILVEVIMPTSKRSRAHRKPREIELVLEMERNNLQWSIYKIDGIKDLTRAIQRTR